MFAVVLGHILTNNKICSMNGYLWHIPGFLLISGYFRINFSFSKLVKLLGIAYACYWMTIPFRSWTGCLSLFVPHGGWFLPFYCVLMLLSLLLNAALESVKSCRMILVAVGILVFVAWVPTLLSDVHVQMLAIPGMQGNGLLLMISTYVFGAMLRRYEVDKWLNAMVWLGLFVVGICACIGMGMLIPSACHFLSPISIITAGFGMMFFLAMPMLPVWLGKCVNFIAPSMFSVYLLHEICVRKFQQLSFNCSVGGAVLLAIGLFCGCVVIDLIRRFIVWSAIRRWCGAKG